MELTPLRDVLQFLLTPAWFTCAYWLLLAISVATAVVVWRRDTRQRTARRLAIWALRTLVGTMWWQQTLWKIPPNFAGLQYWMEQQVEHASVALQSALVRDVVLPNLAIFGPLVYSVELTIAISLLLGICSRVGATLGALMGLNLWLGLYSAPGEWPWTYMFLVIVQVLFIIDPPGRCLGADVLLRQGTQRRRGAAAPLSLAA